MIDIMKSYRDFYSLIAENKYVSITFVADHCKYCEDMKPELKRTLDMGYNIFAFDSDYASPDMINDYQIQTIPTTLIFHGGNLVAKSQGYKKSEDIISFFQHHTGPVREND